MPVASSPILQALQGLSEPRAAKRQKTEGTKDRKEKKKHKTKHEKRSKEKRSKAKRGDPEEATVSLSSCLCLLPFAYHQSQVQCHVFFYSN